MLGIISLLLMVLLCYVVIVVLSFGDFIICIVVAVWLIRFIIRSLKKDKES